MRQFSRMIWDILPHAAGSGRAAIVHIAMILSARQLDLVSSWPANGLGTKGLPRLAGCEVAPLLKRRSELPMPLQGCMVLPSVRPLHRRLALERKVYVRIVMI